MNTSAKKTWTIETVHGHLHTVIGQGPGDRHYAFTTAGGNSPEDCVNLCFGRIMEQGEWEKGSEAWAEVKNAPGALLRLAAAELNASVDQVWFFEVWRNETDIDEA